MAKKNKLLFFVMEQDRKEGNGNTGESSNRCHW